MNAILKILASALVLLAACEGTTDTSEQPAPIGGTGGAGGGAGTVMTGGVGGGGAGGTVAAGTGGTGGLVPTGGSGGMIDDAGAIDSGSNDAGVMDSGTDSGPLDTPEPSAGCGMPAGQALASWVEQPRLRVRDEDRQWWLWLPEDYDPNRVYPVVFTFHGCGGPDNFIPLQEATGQDAIVVRGTGETDSCWTYGADGDDVHFFDAMLDDILAKRCADASRIFIAGFSSGGWLVNTLGCVRGDKIRGGGSVAGGVAINTDECQAPYARIFIHDTDDDTNPFEGQGTREERDRLLEANHCTTTTVAEDPEPCERYQGCDAENPVVLCMTEGKGHARQDDLAKTAFWSFFSSL